MIPAIEFDQVTFEYGAPTKRGLFGRARLADASQGPTSGVHDVSFAVHPGEFVAVIGNNGAGKTTLSKLANGLLKPQSGTVRIDGVPTAELRTSALAARVGMLFQNPDRQICQGTVLEESPSTSEMRMIGRAPSAPTSTLPAWPRTSGCRRTRRRSRSAAASGSAWRSRRWWRGSPACSSSTSRRRAWTTASARAS